MTSSISSLFSDTAFKDYGVSVFLFLVFIGIFYIYNSWRVQKAAERANPKPKSYFVIFLLSLLAMVSIGSVTECVKLTIYRYGFNYYHSDNYFPLIIFATSLITMIAVTAYIREKQRYQNVVFAIILIAIGVLLYGVYQLREMAYPLRNAEIVRNYVTQIFNRSPAPKIPLAILNKEPGIINQIQAQSIAAIYDKQGIDAQKYGLNTENYSLFSEIIFFIINKEARKYYYHATDMDAIKVIRFYIAIYERAAEQDGCTLGVSGYLASSEEDADAEELKRKFIDSMAILIENSDLNRPVPHPTFERYKALLLKVVPPDFFENAEAKAKLSEKQECLASVTMYNSLLKLPDSELAEAARFILADEGDDQ